MFYKSGVVNIGDLVLESGEVLEKVEIAYEWTGQKDKPVILVIHALTGNQFSVGTAENPGWWTGLIGRGKNIDPIDFQIITMNVLGGCNGSTGPMSINQKTKEPYQMSFPVVTVRDSVHAQYNALKKLEIQKLFAILGGSLGGFHVLEWGIIYPDFANSLITLASAPNLSDYGIAFNEIARRAIINDPKWLSGNYPVDKQPVDGLSIARMVGLVTYRNDEMFNTRFARQANGTEKVPITGVYYQIESYMNYQGEKFCARFDSNCYLYLLRMMDQYNIFRGRSRNEVILSLRKSHLLAISYQSDLLYPSNDINDLVKEIGATALFNEVETSYGHDGFLVEYDRWGYLIKDFLQNVSERDVP